MPLRVGYEVSKDYDPFELVLSASCLWMRKK